MNLNDFLTTKPRPLPVFVLADVSGSMRGTKIESLNAALREMVGAFRDLDTVRGEIQVGIITFGGTVQVCSILTPAAELSVPRLEASGSTPMGQALLMLTGFLEDESVVPTRAYTPTLVLVSDGLPTDLPEVLADAAEKGEIRTEDYVEWGPLKALRESKRGSKCSRLAIGIGDDADFGMLRAFVNTPGVPVIRADGARGIHRFFKWVTWSVTTRSVSRDPNQLIIAPTDGFDKSELIM
jgi:uncharacterized protein YegL